MCGEKRRTHKQRMGRGEVDKAGEYYRKQGAVGEKGLITGENGGRRWGRQMGLGEWPESVIYG